MPALLTSISTDPNAFSASVIMDAISSGFNIFAGENSTFTLKSASIAARISSFSSGVPKPLITTLAPCSAKPRAIAKPIPEVEPVITAFLPVSIIHYLMKIIIFRIWKSAFKYHYCQIYAGKTLTYILHCTKRL